MCAARLPDAVERRWREGDLSGGAVCPRYLPPAELRRGGRPAAELRRAGSTSPPVLERALGMDALDALLEREPAKGAVARRAV